MTGKKRLPVQRAADYWTVTEKDPSNLGNRSIGRDSRVSRRIQQQQDRLEPRWQEARGRERESIGTSVSLRRIVTVPQSDPSYAGNTFVERQRQRRKRVQSRGGSSGQTQYVARTLAQTGTRASSGRVPVTPRPLPPQQSPVPARSGGQKLKRNLFSRLLAFFTLLAVIIVVSSFVLTGDAFRIAQVRVAGTRNDLLIRRIQKMGMLGQNIFLIDVAGLTTKIDAQPEVETANLSKQWPSQLVVSIKERVPVLLWQTTKGTFSIDSQGMVIAPADSTVGSAHLGTVIDVSQQRQQANTDKSETTLRPGMRINKTDVTFAVEIVKQLPFVSGESANSYKLYYSGTIYSSTNQTLEGGADGSGSYTLENLVANWKAYLGTANDPNSLSNRLLELRSILAMAQQHQLNVATIDLRYGLNPVFTLQ